MTISELKIQLDISLGNELDVLSKHASKTKYGYLCVDSTDGHCYLFDKHGKIDDISKVKSIGNDAFTSCKSLKSIVIPDSVKSIGDYAFYWCTSLESIIIPDSVKSIGYGAFEYCLSFESVIIPRFVKNIGEWAFASCACLKEVIFKDKTIDQVKAMKNYPWDIEDTSIIKCR